jgi:hypothetical protein
VRPLLLASVLTTLIGGRPVPTTQLVVGVDTRVELLSIVFRLAGAPEYVNNDLAGYAAAVDRHFAAHRDHPVVQQARALRSSLGVSHDAVMMMATHLDSLPGLAERVAFDDPSIVLHQRWRPAEARAFAATLRQFVVDESVVRATSVAWARANLPAADARHAEQTERGRGFFWTVELADSLEGWRAARPSDASWEANGWFVALGDRLPAMRAAYEASRPKIVASSIPDAATEVDPATTLFVVTFDRPMARGWSIQPVQGDTGPLAVPAFRAPRMSADSLRFEVEMELTPGTSYGFALNAAFGGSFRSAEGVPLVQTTLRFHTASAGR